MTRVWVGAAVLAVLAWGITAFVGGWASGKDLGETWAAAGQLLDQSYRAEHWRDSGQFFPMHNRCNADHDLVPGWVNPALVVLPVILVGCLVGAASSSRSRKSHD